MFPISIENKYNELLISPIQLKSYPTSCSCPEQWDLTTETTKWSRKSVECELVNARHGRRMLPLKIDKMEKLAKIVTPVRMAEFIEDFTFMVEIIDTQRTDKGGKQLSREEYFSKYNYLLEKDRFSYDTIKDLTLWKYISLEKESNDEYYKNNQCYKQCESLINRKKRGFAENFQHPYFFENFIHDGGMCAEYLNFGYQRLFQKNDNYKNEDRLINQILWLCLCHRVDLFNKSWFQFDEQVQFVYEDGFNKAIPEIIDLTKSD